MTKKQPKSETTPGEHETINDDNNINDETSLLSNDSVKTNTGKYEGTSGMITTCLNMVKLMIGSGMLTLPWAMSQVGIIPSLIAAFGCATLDFIGAMLLVYASEYSNLFEYSSILRSISKTWEKTGSICLLYVVSGSLIGYLILIGDFITDVFLQFNIHIHRQIIIVLFSVILLTPLTLLKDLKNLKYSSFVGMTAVFYVFCFLLAQTIIHVKDPNFVFGQANSETSEFKWMGWNLGFFVVTNVFTQAYVCHYSVQRIYLSMKDRSTKKAWITNGISYLIVAIIYIIFGCCGYILYGSEVKSDVIVSFESKNNKSLTIPIVIARIAMTLSVGGTYPLAMVSCQANIENNFFNKDNPVWNYKNKKYLREIVILITNILYIILACVIPTIGPVVSINGAVSTIGLIFLFPIASYWKVMLTKEPKCIEVDYGSLNQPKLVTSQNFLSKNNIIFQKIILCIMLSIGVVFGVMGLIMQFAQSGRNS